MNIGYVDNRISKIIGFLGEQGIVMPEPSITFAGKLCSYDSSIIARLNKNRLDSEDIEKFKKTFGRKECEKLEKKLSKLVLPEENLDGDIIIYSLFNSICGNQQYADSILFEEVWHFAEVIENAGNGWISEGTAKYGAKLYSRMEPAETERYGVDIVEKIIKKERKNHRNEFFAMLDPGVRKEMEENFLKRIKKIGIDRFIESF